LRKVGVTSVLCFSELPLSLPFLPDFLVVTKRRHRRLFSGFCGNKFFSAPAEKASLTSSYTPQLDNVEEARKGNNKRHETSEKGSLPSSVLASLDNVKEAGKALGDYVAAILQSDPRSNTL
jgi:hypothetical protein